MLNKYEYKMHRAKQGTLVVKYKALPITTDPNVLIRCQFLTQNNLKNAEGIGLGAWMGRVQLERYCVLQVHKSLLKRDTHPFMQVFAKCILCRKHNSGKLIAHPSLGAYGYLPKSSHRGTHVNLSISRVSNNLSSPSPAITMINGRKHLLALCTECRPIFDVSPIL